MVRKPGDTDRSTGPRSIADVFWAAADVNDHDRTPDAVVRHALASVSMFEEGRVTHPSSGEPTSLMDLLKEMGAEENLIYASPELARGESFDERSLVFTIGVLIFERLTERHPFGTVDNPARVARIRRYEMGSGVNFFPSVPKELRTILMKAMGPFPDERYGGLQALKHDLARFAGQPHLAASKPMPMSKPSVEPTRRQVRPELRRALFFDAPTVVSPPILDFSTDELDLSSLDDQPAPAEESEPPPAMQTLPSAPEPAPEREPPLKKSSREVVPISQIATPREGSSPGTKRMAVLATKEATRLPRRGDAERAPSDREVAPVAQAATPREGSNPGARREQESPLQETSTEPDASLTSAEALPGLPGPAALEAPVTEPDGTPGEAESAPPLEQDRAAPATAPVAATSTPAPTPSAPAEVRPTSPGKRRWTPLLSGLGGAVIAAVAFLIFWPTLRGDKPAPTEAGQTKVQPSTPASTQRSAASTSKPELPKPEPPKPEPEPPKAEPPEPGQPDPKPPASKAEPPAANTPKASTPARPQGELPETAAGRVVADAIRPCGVGEQGKKSLRVAVFIRPPGDVQRAFSNKKQGITEKQLNCIRKKLQGTKLELSWTEAGYIEWSVRLFTDRTEAQVVGPPELRSRLQP